MLNCAELKYGNPGVYFWETCLAAGARITATEVFVLPEELAAMKSRWGEYSCSYPTGIYEGKKWLRNYRAYSNPPGEEWFLAEIERRGDELEIRWRRVVLDEGRMAKDSERRLSA